MEKLSYFEICILISVLNDASRKDALSKKESFQYRVLLIKLCNMKPLRKDDDECSQEQL